MMKYIGKVEKKKVDELMSISYRLKSLMDLKSTYYDLYGRKQNIINISDIQIKDVETKINALSIKKERKLEEIRLEKSWPKNLMLRIHIKENYKAFMEINDDSV